MYEIIDVAEQLRWIELTECGTEKLLGGSWNIFVRENALWRCVSCIVGLLDLGTDALLTLKLARRLEVVLVERKEVVNSPDGFQLLIGIESSISDHLAHDVPVLLLDMS